MRTIRPSLVFSVGDRASEMANRIHDLTRGELDDLESVLAYVDVGTDGRVVRRDGEDHELAVFERLAKESGPTVFKGNFEALIGPNRGAVRKLLEDLTRDIRSKEKIAQIALDTGLADSERNFVYMLADTFGPLSSVFPLAFLHLLREHGLGIAKGFPVTFSLFLFLPDLFEEGKSPEALLRSHAMLTELERFFHEERAGGQVISWKVWLVGSVDRKGSSVDGFEAVVTPTAHFLRRYLDGVLDRDESWINELSERVNQRRTFLSSFGQASLVFPRSYLEETAALLGRRRLIEYLVSKQVKVDPDAISGEAQAWVRKRQLTDLVELLRRGEGGRSIYRDPAQPTIEPATIEPARFEQAVLELLVENPEWGSAVQRAGASRLEQLRQVFLEETSRLVDEEGGFEKGRLFAENLAGVSAGITEATVGIEVLNVENLILKLQAFFARHAEVAGDPNRLIELDRLIPGKVLAIERLTEKAEAEKARAEELEARAEELGADKPAADKAKEEGAETSETREATAETEGTGETGDQAEAEQAPEAEAIGRPGEVRAASAHSAAEERLEATLKDAAELKAELEKLQAEQAEQRRRIAETRRLACDPTRRHLLLEKILDRDQATRDAEIEALKRGVERRNETKGVLEETRRKLRREALIYLVLIPVLAAIPLFIFLVVGWAIWLVVLAGGVIKVIPSLLEFMRARSAHADALRSIRLAAEALWRGHLRELRLRFEFLLYAEATTVLEGLQREILDEESRLARLQKLLAQARERADADWSESELEDSIYRRTVIDAPGGQALVEGDEQISHAAREIVEQVTLSQLLTSFRGQKDTAALPAPIAEAEARLAARSRELLARQHLGTWLESELAAQPRKLTNLWSSVQTAASAWTMVNGTPPPGTLRKLVFYPADLSPGVLEECLKKEALGGGPIEWIKSSDHDDLSVCEMLVGFPSHLVNELDRPEIAKREKIGAFSVAPDGPVLSLPPGVDEIELSEEEGYALVQAALAYLTEAPVDPTRLLARFQRAEFLPDESLSELVERLRALIEKGPEASTRLSEFIAGLRGKRQLKARKLLQGLS